MLSLCEFFFILPWIVVITCFKNLMRIVISLYLLLVYFSLKVFEPLSNSQNMPSVKITQLIYCSSAYMFYLPIFGYIWTVMAALTKLDHNWWSICKSNHSEKKINNRKLEFSFPPFISLSKLEKRIYKKRRSKSG